MMTDGIIYTVAEKNDLYYMGDMLFMEAVGFDEEADEALQTMGVDRLTQIGRYAYQAYTLKWEIRSHWLLPVVAA